MLRQALSGCCSGKGSTKPLVYLAVWVHMLPALWHSVALCSAELSHFLYHLTLQAPENYFYVPDLGQVPEIDVPSYLPDLPGIADDLMYSADLGPGIAPSAPGAIPELPTFHTEVAEPFRPGELGPGIEPESSC